MTRYLSNQPFSVCNAGNKQYASGWDAVFGKKEGPKLEYEALVAETEQGPMIYTTELEAASKALAKRLNQIWFDEYLAVDEKIVNMKGAVIATCPTAEAATAMAVVLNRDLNAKYTSDIRRQVKEFHHAFGHPVRSTPTVPGDEEVTLRLNLIAEELLELLGACGASPSQLQELEDTITTVIHYRRWAAVDIVEVADALGDLDYVIEGTRLAFGINGKPIADEIHRSNMSKLGEDGKPVQREDGKTLKGPSYSPPDIQGKLVAQGWSG